MSCATRYSYEQLASGGNGWIGRSKDEYVRANGIPFREYKYSDGSSLVQYKIVGRKEITDGTGPKPYATVDTWNTVYEEYTISPTNIITGWKARN